MTGADRLGVRLRPATADDVDAVTGLERRTFGADAWSRATVHGELTSPLREAVVAVDGTGRVCGYAVVLGIADVADLQRIVVAPAYRRRGVGTALLEACDLAARERTVLEVRADNHAALAFYRRNAFAEILRRRAYYADGADAVVMQRDVMRADR